MPFVFPTKQEVISRCPMLLQLTSISGSVKAKNKRNFSCYRGITDQQYEGIQWRGFLYRTSTTSTLFAFNSSRSDHYGNNCFLFCVLKTNKGCLVWYLGLDVSRSFHICGCWRAGFFNVSYTAPQKLFGNLTSKVSVVTFIQDHQREWSSHSGPNRNPWR